MVDVLRRTIASNRAGQAVAIPSVCSAHPEVIRAAVLLADELDRTVVIEATSNQVNQDGGYTGLRPADFVALVHDIADHEAVARERIVFGGDHLGPQAWRQTTPDIAMAKAHAMVKDYVAAGFHKIHLDCSEGCAGEPPQLDDAMTATRSAALARSCLEHHDDLLFVVGTEVPPPGGARLDEDDAVVPTQPEAAAATTAVHADAFGDMTPLIGGLVVQPGVEFSPSAVHHLPMDRDPGLMAALVDYPQVTLEAHSTDYQHPEVYPRLAALGFGFQKVGPALTFAYREALYRLDAARAAATGGPHHLRDTMEAVMLADPGKWQGHYHGDVDTLRHLRHAGLADRIRYYWPQPAAQAAVVDLIAFPFDDAALCGAFDTELRDRAEALRGPLAQRCVIATIQRALRPYFFDGDAT